MAVITETPVWVDDIYEIQRADPVLGGTHNISNLQGESLANRTAYLKKEQDSIKTDLYTDRKFAHLDEDGRIPYSELPESAMEYKGLIDPVLTPNTSCLWKIIFGRLAPGRAVPIRRFT